MVLEFYTRKVDIALLYCCNCESEFSANLAISAETVPRIFGFLATNSNGGYYKHYILKITHSAIFNIFYSFQSAGMKFGTQYPDRPICDC